MTPLLIVALVQPVRACPADHACPVEAGQCVSDAGWFLPPPVYANALKCADVVKVQSVSLDACRDARDALRLDLDKCAADLTQSAAAVRPPPPAPLPAQAGGGRPDPWRAAWPLAGAACVAGAWAAAEWSDIGAGLSMAAGGACVAGVGLLAWRW